jgi:hypothetical protein
MPSILARPGQTALGNTQWLGLPDLGLFGGGFHRFTLDTIRDGGCEDYLAA